ncbi:hypothetical protein M433DRAFT_156123 [Acidomyces richmondensis BFW]|nr:MAG: hypothetical protein FE78DRAFT_92770 [Acidomyces sp. 'richmondensis']KYG43972.1 hypothetical protein M433DRAFT_156123 [Acidomyces richmondensis BFW]
MRSMWSSPVGFCLLTDSYDLTCPFCDESLANLSFRLETFPLRLLPLQCMAQLTEMPSQLTEKTHNLSCGGCAAYMAVAKQKSSIQAEGVSSYDCGENSRRISQLSQMLYQVLEVRDAAAF